MFGTIKTSLKDKRLRKSHRSMIGFEPMEPRQMLAADWLLATGDSLGQWDTPRAGIEVDAADNTYTAGLFQGSLDLDPVNQYSGDIDIVTSNGGQDFYVAKYSSNNQLLWAKSFGGSSEDGAWDLTVDDNANVYITGWFTNTVDFDPTSSHGGDRDIATSAGGYDVYVLKLNSAGAFQWVAAWGGSGSDVGVSVDVDRLGNVYATSGDITKYDSNGSVIWRQNIQATGDGKAVMMIPVINDTDPDPTRWQLYTAGLFRDGDLDLASIGGSGLIANQGEYDNFVLELSPDDGLLVNHVVYGGTGNEKALSFDGDGVGNLYVGGFFEGTIDFNPDPSLENEITSVHGADVYVAKFNSDLSFSAATSFGGVGFESTMLPAGISTTNTGEVYVTGQFEADISIGDTTLISAGGSDAFLAELDSDLNVQWAVRAGGSGVSRSELDSIDNSNQVQGLWRAYGKHDDGGIGTAMNSQGLLYWVGDFKQTANFPGAEVRSSSGHADIFLAKFDPDEPRIAGNIFSDFDADGVRNGGLREGIPDGRQVYLDTNNNGMLDSGEPIATTAGNSGDFDFGTVSPGTYVVRQVLPSEWFQTFPVDGMGTPVPYVLSVATGDGPINLEFGSTPVVTEVTYSSSDTPLAIRDLRTTSSTIAVPDSLTILDLDVVVDILHENNADLDAFLVAPDGTKVELFTDVGGSSDDFNGTVLNEDELFNLVENGSGPFGGTYKPEGDLSVLDGKNIQGTWTLEVTDDSRIGRKGGTLNSWSLSILAETPPPPARSLSINDVSVPEGDSGTTQADFTVTRSGDTTGTVTVDSATQDGLAQDGGAGEDNDYQSTSGTLTFLPGDTSKTISVTIHGDTDDEGIESFFVNLSNATGEATINDPIGEATIQNDDAAVISIYIADIRFDSKRGGKDWRAVVEVRNADDDSPVAGVSLKIDFAETTYSVTTDSNGIARTGWERNLASGSYYADAYDLVLAGFDWDPFVLDLEDDSDGDGKPDDLLTV